LNGSALGLNGCCQGWQAHFDANAPAVVEMRTPEKTQPINGYFEMQSLLEQTAIACAGCPRSANTAAGLGTPE
jgi:hypothetical protein